MSHVKNNSNSTPFNLRNKNSLRNTLEKLNSKPKKNISSKKSKNNSKDSEIFILIQHAVMPWQNWSHLSEYAVWFLLRVYDIQSRNGSIVFG